jgi:CRISPR-associated protein Cmr6
MPFFYLNKVEKSITKNELEKEFKKFGQLKFVGNFKDDTRNEGFNTTIAEFKELDNETGFVDFCKSKKIFTTKRKDATSQSSHQSTAPQQRSSQHESIRQSGMQTSSIANPSFYFYKDKAYGKGIENFSLSNNFKEAFEISGLEKEQTFELTTTYPGLLVGSGYNHPKLKENTDDFQLGFFFDHTTGLPIISGSSIKGLLRSVYKQKEFMQDVYGRVPGEEIFEDQKTVFYDAYIISTQNKEAKVFGSDYITSHFSNEPEGMFKEPNPIKFLKILPNVTFKFQFNAPKEDVKLFEAIIKDFGLGAKTNVGFGKFIEVGG